MFAKFKTKDLVTIAMMAAVIGAFFTVLDGFYNPISELLGPTFSGMTFGIYALSCLLPGYVVKKPGAAFIGSCFAAGINILTGSPYGIHIMVAGACQGLGAEVGFGIGKYKSYGIVNFAISAVFITIFVSLRDYFVFSLGAQPVPVILSTLVVRFASCTIFGFALCKAIGIALEKVGLMRTSAV